MDFISNQSPRNTQRGLLKEHAAVLPLAVELRHIDKRFGAVHANRDVSLSIAAGSVTGIVGENGAGKSTLMSILCGFYEADSGEILIDGKPVLIARPADAIALGIGMVHQHFVLVDTFTVLENIMLGAELPGDRPECRVQPRHDRGSALHRAGGIDLRQVAAVWRAGCVSDVRSARRDRDPPAGRPCRQCRRGAGAADPGVAVPLDRDPARRLHRQGGRPQGGGHPLHQGAMNGRSRAQSAVSGDAAASARRYGARLRALFPFPSRRRGARRKRRALTDTESYFVSEASVYRLLKARDLIASPAFIVIKAADAFKDKTTAPNQLWQTDFTYLKVIGWGWFYLSTVLDDFSRYIVAWKLCTSMRAEDVTA